MIASVGPLGIRTGAPQPVLQTVPCHLEENPNPTIAALASWKSSSLCLVPPQAP